MSALYVVSQAECSKHCLARVHGPTWGGGIAWSDRRVLREWDSGRSESGHQLSARVDGYFRFYVIGLQPEVVLCGRSRSRHQQTVVGKRIIASKFLFLKEITMKI